MHPRIQSRREELSGASGKRVGQMRVDELMATIGVIEDKFRAALTGEQLDDMLGQLQAARCLVGLAVNGNADGNNLLICANAVMLQLRSRIEALRFAEPGPAAVGQAAGKECMS